jgi:N-acetylglucosaminyldiphosphoundecaprenol N-acetyl-beta-D-mannosaminyltransferase
MNRIDILGVRVDDVSLEEILSKIDEIILSKKHAIIAHVHVMGMNIACEQKWFNDFLDDAELVYCDGMGVKLGAHLLGYHSLERNTLADWIWPLAQFAEERGFSFFFLGNPEGVAERAASRLKERYSNIKIAGTYQGFFDKNPGSPENQHVLKKINQLKPDLLIVGFGMPIQEKWLLENWDRIDANLAITAGALFEYVAGDLRRGPKWLTNNYLEWLVRLVISPRRYLKRYLKDNVTFLCRIVRQKVSSANHQV